MKTLLKKDEIKMGVYAGEKLEVILKICGKEALIQILKYYNVSRNIMKEYHLQKIKTVKEDEQDMYEDSDIPKFED